MSNIEKPSPTKPQGGAPAPGPHGDYVNTVAPTLGMSLSSSPEVYASNTHDATVSLLLGLLSRDRKSPTKGSAFAQFKQPIILHSPSNPDEQLLHAKQGGAQQSLIQPDDEETELDPVVDQPSVHLTLAPAPPNGSSGAGPTLARPVPTPPTSANDTGQSDPVGDKFEMQQEHPRRGPLLLGPFLEARYQSLRNTGSYDKVMSYQQPSMS